MRRTLMILAVGFLMFESKVALGYHGTMPEEVYAKLQGFGVTFIEHDGPVLRHGACSPIQQALLKSGPLGRALGRALFAAGDEAIPERLIGAEVRDDKGDLSFVWRSPDFWQLAACHYPEKYGGNQPTSRVIRGISPG